VGVHTRAESSAGLSATSPLRGTQCRHRDRSGQEIIFQKHRYHRHSLSLFGAGAQGSLVERIVSGTKSAIPLPAGTVEVGLVGTGQNHPFLQLSHQQKQKIGAGFAETILGLEWHPRGIAGFQHIGQKRTKNQTKLHQQSSRVHTTLP